MTTKISIKTDVKDVVITSPVDGQVLTVLGANLVNAALPTGHAPVTITDTATISLTLLGQALSAALRNTTVTPGSYTNTNLTVDAQGRITAASNGSSGSAGHTIQDGGVPLTARANLNFVGPGVTVTDDPTNSATKVEINATGSGSSTGTNIYIDQSGGTSDSYGILSGIRNGVNTEFTVSKGVYLTGSLSVYLNGQLLTQGSVEDWHETLPASGTFNFTTAPASTDEITVTYTDFISGLALGTIVFSWDGSGSTITVPQDLDIFCPVGGTLSNWHIFSDTAATATIDVWKTTYASFPPTITNTICGGSPITLNGVENANMTLTGWIKTISANDVIRVHLSNLTNAKRLLVIFSYIKN